MILSTLYAQAGQQSLNLGLVGYWPLDGNSRDSISVNNGTDTSVTYSAGQVANGGVFNGSSSYILMGNPVLTTGKMSASAWVKTTAVSAYKEIVMSGYQVSQVAGFELRMSNGNLAQLVIGNNTNLTQGSGYQFCSSTSAINTGSWVHVVGTYDGANLKIYVNGSLQNTVAYAGGMVFNATRYSSIGSNDVSGSPQYFWNGMLDDVKIWNRDLSATEVTALYNATYTSPILNNLIGYWPLESSSVDSTGTYTGTDTNMSYGAGKVGNCGIFNGGSSFITLPAMSWTGGVMSVAAWIKTSYAGGNYQEIVCCMDQDAATIAGFEFRLNPSGQLDFVVGTNTGWGTGAYGDITSTGAVNNGAWHFVVGTHDGATMRLYVDGTQVQTVAFAYPLAFSSVKPARIGITYYVQSSTNLYFWNGSIDEVGVWSRVLSAAEVTALYNAGTGKTYPLT